MVEEITGTAKHNYSLGAKTTTIDPKGAYGRK